MEGLCLLKPLAMILVLEVIRFSDGNCQHPGRPAGSNVYLNARVRSNGTYPFGTIASYHCERGYLEGYPYERICLSNGSWNYPSITVKCEMDPCKRLLDDEWPIASHRVNNTCLALHRVQKGKKLQIAIAQCGQISNTSKISEMVEFFRLPTAQHTIMNSFCERSNYQHILLITNEMNFSNYFKRKIFTIHCGNPPELKDMDWFGFLLTYQFWICIYDAKCASPSQNENTKLILSAQNNNLARYSCPEGLSLKGSRIRSCKQNGQWSGKTPVCGQDITCAPPSENKNTIVFISGQKVGDFVRYSCPTGLVLQGPNYRVCQQDGRWSNTAPMCLYFWCPLPKRAENASFTLLDGSNFNGTRLKQWCSSGLVMVSGTQFRQCIHGQWDGEEAVCQFVPAGSKARATLRYSSSVLFGLLLDIIMTLITII